MVLQFVLCAFFNRAFETKMINTCTVCKEQQGKSFYILRRLPYFNTNYKL